MGEDAGPSPYSLFYETNVGQIRSEPLWRGKNWVGTSSKNTIKIEDGRSCSRRHASVTVDKNSFIVQDLGSTNGTRVNGKKITGPTPVPSGEVFMAGKVKLWIDLNANAEKHLLRNTLLNDKYFRLFLLLVVIIVLMVLRSCFRGGG
jgi:pSer/pThr/pTyr-binding forkhead associated (FHA) protein